MYLVDSHCHLDQLNEPLDDVFKHAKSRGVQHMLCVCITLQDFPKVLAIANAHTHVSASVGLHPNEVVEQEPTVDELLNLAKDQKIVAIGETGLDYYRSVGDLDWQRARFRTHIQAAKEVNKPLIIHSRQAKADTIQILKEENAHSGVMHCFTEDWEMAKAALDLGFYISFSGIVTFKNAKEIQSVASKVPLDRLLFETDAPYLAPEPYRGQPNTPAYVRYVAEFIADLRRVNVVELSEMTTGNFFRLFQLANR